MGEEDWIEFARKNNGFLIAWVNQKDDPQLKPANIEGVCAAMAIEYVQKCTKGPPGFTYFIQEIEDVKNVPPVGTKRIPARYIELQTVYESQLLQFKKNNQILKIQIESADKEKLPELSEKLKLLMHNHIVSMYGPLLTDWDRIDDPYGLGGITILENLKKQEIENGPSYFSVGMRKGKIKGGHAVAFGYRPDLSFEGFPKVYEYFDANLGLFLFPSLENLTTFFDYSVWSFIYATVDFRSFEIATFSIPK